jgi:hypothetical protein
MLLMALRPFAAGAEVTIKGAGDFADGASHLARSTGVSEVAKGATIVIIIIIIITLLETRFPHMLPIPGTVAWQREIQWARSWETAVSSWVPAFS